MAGLAFVLSGGGNRGAFQAEAIKVLIDGGVRPSQLVGTSVGAVNAAFLPASPTPKNAGKLIELWKSMSGADVFPGFSPLRIWRLLRGDDDLHSSKGLERLLEPPLPCHLLEAGAAPLVVVAADLLTNRERYLTHGPVVQAALASAAIPGIFPVFIWEGEALVDGGVAANAPMAAAVAYGADEAWVLNTTQPCEHPRLPLGAVDVVLQALALSNVARVQSELVCPPGNLKVHYLPLMCAESRWFSNFCGTPSLILREAELTRHYRLDHFPPTNVSAHHPGMEPPQERPTK